MAATELLRFDKDCSDERLYYSNCDYLQYRVTTHSITIVWAQKHQTDFERLECELLQTLQRLQELLSHLCDSLNNLILN